MVYCDYIKELANQGFEISFHNATMESSSREVTVTAIESFKKKLGFYPRSHAAHAQNSENLYWGKDRFSTLLFKKIYSLWKGNEIYHGEKTGNEYFWGDICKEIFDTVRTFTYAEINLRNIHDSVFYSDSTKPYFNSCFISADADNVEEFNELLSLKNQEKLVDQQGICIISTHFGKGFVDNGELNPTTDFLLTELSKKGGWFVPVIEIYDLLKGQNAIIEVSRWKRFLLEFKWFLHAIKRKRLQQDYKKTELEYLGR